MPDFFLKKFLFFRKSVRKLKYWKRSKSSVIFTRKYACLLNGQLFWKSILPFFRETCILSAGFKMKPLRVFLCQDKNQLTFCLDIFGKSSRSFLFKLIDSRYIPLLADSGSIKKLFSIDYANIYLFSTFFSIDFDRLKSVGLPHIAFIMIH